MHLRIEQGCPQCGGPVELTETDRLLTCSFCGTRNYLQGNGPFRYVLPMAKPPEAASVLLAPYLRFKGTIYLVSERGLSHRVVDTTQAAAQVAGLPPSLGVRPQAMRLRRIDAGSGASYLPRQIKAGAILAKAAAVGRLTVRTGGQLFHRAYIGESLSYIYLPLLHKRQGVFDGVTGLPLAPPEQAGKTSLRGRPFQEAWQVRFLPTLCPQCGAGLHGSTDCQVMVCTHCHTTWSLVREGLAAVDWRFVPGTGATRLYLPFWRIRARIPTLAISSFADFVERTNQPFLPRPQWGERGMSFWVPAIKLRPKVFLQASRQATLAQWRLNPVSGRIQQLFYPVTLPETEARQAIKIILAAAATAGARLIFPALPEVRTADVSSQLVYLPCVDKGHDWVQPETGIAVGKNVLRLGRSI
ncbi:hypothetical protein [Desulfobulbus alkaliphilus]|uniref:hypothetical protein n=1 Tax=Desulfobulbus alkaliphilus TaxID=869814 RepID=UPI00196353DF|nr:hypothetical protein [Desulfobulbus alkaliphilus]MBM9535528.1 hypothetical protein [Desulfobulbus alkaliphilus]